MASRLYGIRSRFLGCLTPFKNVLQQPSLRRVTTTPFGGVVERPPQSRFGLIKAVVVVTPFLYLGATISKEGAALLEDWGYFIPEDDDDDD